MKFFVAVALAFTVSSAMAADMPVFTPQTLVLKDIPAPTGPAVALFDGADLDQWDA